MRARISTSIEGAARKCRVFWLALSFSAIGRCAYIVVPNDFALTDANDANIFPFGVRFTNSSMRYQQVYDASEFSEAPTNGALITEIAFRVDASTRGAFGGILSNIQVNLSTTTKLPDGLSATFNENIGRDDTIVFGPGPVPMQTSLSFLSLRISLPSPFRYFPAAGNLLLDVRNFQGYNCLAPSDCPPLLDAAFLTNDSVSRIYANTVDAPTASELDTFGLVTQFEFFPVPQLTNRLDTNAVIVTWATYPKVFVPQSTTNLNSANWVPITNEISGNETFQTLILPRDSLGSMQFFRLVWPEGASGVN